MPVLPASVLSDPQKTLQKSFKGDNKKIENSSSVSPFLGHFTIEIADFQSLIKYLKVKHKEYPCQTLAVGNLKSLDLEKIGLKGVLLALLG